MIRLTQHDKERMVLYLHSLQWKTADCTKAPKSHPDSITHRDAGQEEAKDGYSNHCGTIRGPVRTSRQSQGLAHSPKVLCLWNATISGLEFMTLNLKNPRALHTPNQLPHSPRRPHSQSLRALKVTD